MDTREKILSLSEVDALLCAGEWLVAVGQFDPLTAGQASRLHALRGRNGKLLVVVLENSQALLPGAARAALIAALRDVNAVIIAEPDKWRNAIPSAADVLVIEDPEAEKARSADFVRYVVTRQAAASNGGHDR